jgi:hypothetical protein
MELVYELTAPNPLRAPTDMMTITRLRTAASPSTSGDRHQSCLDALVRRNSFSLVAAAALTACGGCNGVTPSVARDLSMLVQLTCDLPTVHEFQLYWDDRLVDSDVYQAITVDITSLSYEGKVSPGDHKIGVAIASQTASPNRCYIYGLVTTTTGGVGNGPQAIVVPGEFRSLATGVVTTVVVTIK